MRKLYILLAFLLLSISAKSQRCTTPIPAVALQQQIRQLSAIRGDQKRLDMATEFARRNCLLAYQVKQVAGLFKDDITRLEFVQDAYPAIFDKENYYDLYDAFAYFSTAMRFHDFMEAQNQRGRRQDQYYDESDRPYTFPNYNYPSYESYHEQTPCSQPLSDEAFFRLLRNVMTRNDDESRVTAAIQLVENNCLTVAQIMKMGSLIEKEAKRLDYLKRSYDYSYDVGNFQYSNQLFKEKTYSSDFENFMRDRRSRTGRQDQGREQRDRNCRIAETEFQEIYNTIKGQSFENTQITMAKQIVRTKQCFTTLQIKRLIEIFRFENTKLDMAKYCYAFCIDRDDYYKINSLFTFSGSVDELTKFINEQENNR